MKGVLAWLMLGSVCLGQTIASRRYAELTPEQYVFSPLTAVAPFNMVPSYTSTSTLAQLQPAGLLYGTSTFASTSDFTPYTIGTPCTFSVASNTGTVACGANSNTQLALTSATLTAPTTFTSMTVQTNGTAGSGSFDIAGLGLMKSGSNMVTWVVDRRNNFLSLFTVISGTIVNTNFSFTPPSAPWQMGVSLVGNNFCFWDNTGSGWVNIRCSNVSSTYNFQTTGNLSGWQPGIFVNCNVSSTWTFKNFSTGAFGAASVKDISLVTYADGRPYMQGSVAYFIATSQDGTANGLENVFSYDVVGGTLTQIGAIFNVRSGSSLPDVAGDLKYDPGNNNYRYMIGGWSTASPPPTWYGAWSKASIDPLAGGVVLVTAATQMTFSQTQPNWDTHFVCTQWNYSAGTCGKWFSSFASVGNGNPYGNSSTSDPSSNSWSAVGTLSTNYSEGERILRTATGSGGVLYEAVYVSALNGAFNGSRENTFFPTASSSSFSAVGTVTAQVPGGPYNIPHPQIFSYGNTEYLVTFNNVVSSSGLNTMGDWLVATAPKYSAQPNYPKFVTGTSNFVSGSGASITSSAQSVTTGDLVIVYCRAGTTASSSIAVTSSVSMGSFTGVGFNKVTTGSGNGLGEAFYVFATGTGSSTFTCTPSASESFQGVTVMVYHPGFVTTVDSTAIANQLGSSLNLYTSPSFSTTAKGIAFVCTDGMFGGAGSYIPGFIGPYADGPANGVSSGAAMCTSTVTPAAQTGITATVGTTSASPAQWAGATLSFK